MAASGVRVTVITSEGLALADSQSDPHPRENRAERPEIREALANGDGLSLRHSVTINRDLLYYAVLFSVPGGPPFVLRFALPVRAVNEEVWASRSRLWFSSLIVFLVTGMASLLISRTFARRVERLQFFSRRVAEGDFRPIDADRYGRSEEHTSELQSRLHLVCRLLLEKKKYFHARVLCVQFTWKILACNHYSS